MSFSRHGPPDVLQVVEMDIPAPGSGAVLVHNHAIGVNYVDVQHRQGGYYEVALPLIPGIDPDKTQSEHFPQHKTAHFLQQLIFPQSAHLLRLSNKR